MSETQEGARPGAEDPGARDRCFADIVRTLVGQTVMVVNPESYEHAPVGYQLKPGFYRAKVTAGGADHLTLLTEFKKPGREGGKEVVRQFVPFTQIKRVSMTKGERYLHL